MEVPLEDTERYGICAGDWENKREMRVKRMLEKPHPKIAPSNLGIVGRYVVPPEIFDLLEKHPQEWEEIQLTDALHMMARMNRVITYKFEGDRFDTGNALGLLHASMYQAYHRPNMQKQFLDIIAKFAEKLPSEKNNPNSRFLTNGWLIHLYHS